MAAYRHLKADRPSRKSAKNWGVVSSAQLAKLALSPSRVPVLRPFQVLFSAVSILILIRSRHFPSEPSSCSIFEIYKIFRTAFFFSNFQDICTVLFSKVSVISANFIRGFLEQADFRKARQNCFDFRQTSHSFREFDESDITDITEMNFEEIFRETVWIFCKKMM